jgi:hypothetical protein
LLWLCGLVRLRSEGLRIPRRPKSERGHPGWGLGTTTTVPPAAAASCSRTEGGRECDLQPVETKDKLQNATLLTFSGYKILQLYPKAGCVNCFITN